MKTPNNISENMYAEEIQNLIQDEEDLSKHKPLWHPANKHLRNQTMITNAARNRKKNVKNNNRK